MRSEDELGSLCFKRAICYLNLGDLKSGETELTNGIEFNPRNEILYKLYQFRGAAHGEQGEWNQV